MASVFSTLLTPVSTTLCIKKSEFITYAYPVEDRSHAMDKVDYLKQQYPDARHHCWAYIIGNPSNTTSAGFDDDGEPSGTAGKPIFQVMQHKSIGNCLIVVVRYFGGIKLGAGGLVRAYSGAAQAVVDIMDLQVYVPYTTIKVTCAFANESQVRYQTDQLDGHIIDADYQSNVILTLKLPCRNIAALQDNLVNIGHISHQEANEVSEKR